MSICFRCGKDYSSPHKQYLCDACLKALGWDLPSVIEESTEAREQAIEAWNRRAGDCNGS